MKRAPSMPYLPLEPFVWPNSLFEQAAPPPDQDGRWWVLRTRPRAEKALARHLLARDLRFFLPQYQKRSRSNGRNFDSFHPLFAGYMFLHGDGNDRLRALETNQIAQVLQVDDQVQLHQDLLRVHGLMLSDTALSPEERLEPGMLVEIMGGPLMGMKGKIVTRHNKKRFLVEVRFLQQGVSVDVEGWMIQPVRQQPVLAV
jgi:transcription antitermination factor NusG